MFEIFVFVYFAKQDFWRKRKASNKCILCILLKASISELWHNICCGVLMRSQHLLTWSSCDSLCIDVVSCMSALWSCLWPAMDTLRIWIALVSFSCTPVGSGKVVVLGRHELVPNPSSRRVCPAQHGEARGVVIYFTSGNVVGGYLDHLSRLQTESCLVASFCRYHHLSLQGTGYGSVACQPLSKAHTVQRGRDEGPVATD